MEGAGHVVQSKAAGTASVPGRSGEAEAGLSRAARVPSTSGSTEGADSPAVELATGQGTEASVAAARVSAGASRPATSAATGTTAEESTHPTGPKLGAVDGTQPLEPGSVLLRESEMFAKEQILQERAKFCPDKPRDVSFTTVAALVQVSADLLVSLRVRFANGEELRGLQVEWTAAARQDGSAALARVQQDLESQGGMELLDNGARLILPKAACDLYPQQEPDAAGGVAAVELVHPDPEDDRASGFLLSPAMGLLVDRELEEYQRGLAAQRGGDVEEAPPSAGDLPGSFSWRTVAPSCLDYVHQQDDCGACYMFAAVDSVADRHCISHGASSLGNEDHLSVQMALMCEPEGLQCSGGWAYVGFNYTIQHGLNTEAAWPYERSCLSDSVCQFGKQCATRVTLNCSNLFGASELDLIKTYADALEQVNIKCKAPEVIRTYPCLKWAEATFGPEPSTPFQPGRPWCTKVEKEFREFLHKAPEGAKASIVKQQAPLNGKAKTSIGKRAGRAGGSNGTAGAVDAGAKNRSGDGTRESAAPPRKAWPRPSPRTGPPFLMPWWLRGVQASKASGLKNVSGLNESASGGGSGGINTSGTTSGIGGSTSDVEASGSDSGIDASGGASSTTPSGTASDIRASTPCGKDPSGSNASGETFNISEIASDMEASGGAAGINASGDAPGTATSRRASGVNTSTSGGRSTSDGTAGSFLSCGGFFEFEQLRRAATFGDVHAQVRLKCEAVAQRRACRSWADAAFGDGASAALLTEESCRGIQSNFESFERPREATPVEEDLQSYAIPVDEDLQAYDSGTSDPEVLASEHGGGRWWWWSRRRRTQKQEEKEHDGPKGTTDDGKTPKSLVRCDRGRCSTEKRMHTLRSFHYVTNLKEHFRKELYEEGPFYTSFYVYEDFTWFFREWPTEAYNWQWGKELGGHAVVLVGWEDNCVYHTGSKSPAPAAAAAAPGTAAVPVGPASLLEAEEAGASGRHSKAGVRQHRLQARAARFRLHSSVSRRRTARGSCWQLRNSWGPEWADGGYFRMTEDMLTGPKGTNILISSVAGDGPASRS